MSCKILLTNYHRPYFPGNNIVGKVICHFTLFEDIEGITIKINGVENVYIRETEHNYAAKNSFFKEKVELATAGSMSPGEHEFQFVLTLPLRLPSTFNGKYGWMSYTLVAKVVRPWKMNYRDSLQIPVISPLDQNKIEDRGLLLPATFQSEKTFWCLCCITGMLTMEVNLERMSFVPGEKIKVVAKIKNRSRQSVRKVKAIYWIKVTSVVPVLLGAKTLTQKFIIVKAKSETGVGANDEKIYELFLKLPMIDAVPNFNGSKILVCSMSMEVVAVLSKFHFNMSLPVNATLADIPVGGAEEYYARIDQAGVYHPPMKRETPKNFHEQSIIRFM